MSTIGKTQITIIFIAPPNLVSEGDKLFASHARWMERTHYREGEKALLRYNIIKAPELKEPFNPSSEPTGNTMFVLDELYETQAGLDDHWKQAAENWEDLGAILEWAGKCKVITAHNGKAV
ncbi:MAG TPA: hypothetical protein VGA95_07480, partial [Thermodesulfobacteriota bacterium]